jgi:hypothetical protein
VAATLPYRKACAITGPFYRYNPALRNTYRLPPHLDGKWLISDFNLSWIDAVTLDPSGRVLSRAGILNATGTDDFDNPVEIEVGPDGGLYAMNYSGYRTWSPRTGLMRIEYRGSCLPMSVTRPLARGQGAFRLEGRKLILEGTGPHAVTVRDPTGRQVAAWKGNGPGDYELPREAAAGVRFLEIGTSAGIFRQTFVSGP